MPSSDVFLNILKIAAVFIGVSFIVFWVGLVWWVAQDALSRTEDKIILAAAVAMTAILGPVGALLYLVIRPKQTLQESVGEMMEREMLLHASSTTICPTCGRMALEDFLSCPHCATLLKEHCPQCQKLVSVEWSHCPYCAAKLQPKRFPEANARSAINRRPPEPMPISRPKPNGSLELVTATEVKETLSEQPIPSIPAMSRAQSLTKASAQVVQQSTKTSLTVLKEVINSTRSTVASHASKGAMVMDRGGKKAIDSASPKLEEKSSDTVAPSVKVQDDNASTSSSTIFKSDSINSAGSRRAKHHRANKK